MFSNFVLRFSKIPLADGVHNKKDSVLRRTCYKKRYFSKEVFMSYWRKKKKAIELCHLRKNKFMINLKK
jgi:hypothetical protein